MSNKSEIIRKEKVVQSIVIADTFNDEFVPISDDIPHALLPILNKPLVDYTLEFLSLGGIEEVFLFCSVHSDEIKQHIDKCIKNGDGWTLTMKVNVIVSESCQSFGDCLRDLDARGLLRGEFVLLEPGVLSNVPLLSLLEKHSEIVKADKYAAMTLILQESGIGHRGRGLEDILLATDSLNRVLFYKNVGNRKTRKIEFPMDIFLENSSISILHNLKDSHIAICSSSVLPLFSDNFDFQTKDDLIRGLLMNEEILEGTIYAHVLQGCLFGGAVSSWRMYQSLSQELIKKWIHPLNLTRNKNRVLKNNVVIGAGTTIPNSAKISRSILGASVSIGDNVTVEDSFIFSDTKIQDDVIITHSVISSNCTIKSNSKISLGSIVGTNTVLEDGTVIENALVQSKQPNNGDEYVKLGNKAFELKISSDDDGDSVLSTTGKKPYRLHITDIESDDEEDDDSDGFSDSEEELSYTQSPVPDDTKLFFSEVIDSLTRGFDDNLLCDNLILEINSSRYAYNVTVKEVNFNVVKAILSMSLREPIGVPYFSHLSRLLSYFYPVLKNYIRNEDAMLDCLQALEEVATSGESFKEKWVIAVLQHMYNKDYLAEDVILEWYRNLDSDGKFVGQVKPFADWLQEAEEASSDDEDVDDSD